ncbi:NADH-quinone oxidoreductase subunit C [Sphingosinithalassobacter sp. CS137]|uniref:NADH-quinone oxidoreductase subunit C n=1 Tax=Sphingosinithalassobacter sp. CS137 TaxID=2762748 RepID=UPI00165D801D
MRASAPRYPAVEVASFDSLIEAGLVREVRAAVGELSFHVDRDKLIPAMEALREEHGYQQLMEIAGVDYPDRPERFELVYCLLSLTRNHRIKVKVATDEVQPVPSVTGIWPVAGWLEREVYDMYGVLFEGNTDLRRILTDYGFVGHPQRKDFPLTGYVELRYSEEAKRVVYQPVELAQDFRNFDFMSPWEGAQYVLPGDEKSEGAVPEAKGAPTPLKAETIVKADEAADRDVKPQAREVKTTESTAQTGAGEPNPGNQPQDKPKDPDVVPTKEGGQNE